MLKLQEDYTTLTSTFEDFILLVYTVMDDLYQQFALVSVSRRRNWQNARLSDSEIITLNVCGELLGIDSENAWYAFVKKITGIFFRGFAAEPGLSAPEDLFYR